MNLGVCFLTLKNRYDHNVYLYLPLSCMEIMCGYSASRSLVWLFPPCGWKIAKPRALANQLRNCSLEAIALHMCILRYLPVMFLDLPSIFLHSSCSWGLSSLLKTPLHSADRLHHFVGGVLRTIIISFMR